METNRSRMLNVLLFAFASIALALVLFSVIKPSNGNKRNSPNSEVTSTLSKVKQSRVLKAGYVVYPPFVVRDPQTDKLSGYFIDLMEIVAMEAGFRIEYEEATWASMIAGLQTGKFDLVVSAVFRTIPRSYEVTFGEPILYLGIGGIVRADDGRVQDANDLGKPGIRIAVLNGAVSHEFIRKRFPDASLTVVSGVDISRPLLEVMAGRADIGLAETIICTRFAREHPEVKNPFAKRPLSMYGASMMTRHGDDDWTKFIDTAISRLLLDGTTDRLDAKYRTDIGDAAWFTKQKPWISED